MSLSQCNITISKPNISFSSFLVYQNRITEFMEHNRAQLASREKRSHYVSLKLDNLVREMLRRARKRMGRAKCVAESAALLAS